MRRLTISCGLAIALVTVGLSPAMAKTKPIRYSFYTAWQGPMAQGTQMQMIRARNAPIEVYAVRISGNPLSSVLSNDRLSETDTNGRLETTSSMSRRRKALYGVNADFFDLGSKLPVGGMVTGGRAISSGRGDHEQVTVTPDGLTTQPLQLTFQLTGTFVEPPPLLGLRLKPDTSHSTALSGNSVNRWIGGGLTLFTPTFGDSTQTDPSVTELVVGNEMPALGQETAATPLELRGGNSPIPRNGLVISGSGAGAGQLQQLWQDWTSWAGEKSLSLGIASNLPAWESVGGHPIIISNGQLQTVDLADPMLRSLHARTLAAQSPDGTVWLIVADKHKKKSRGLNYTDEVDLLRFLGATKTAINLDGGGSSTFYSATGCPPPLPTKKNKRPGMRPGGVCNNPSDGRERPTGNALVVLPR